MRKKKITRSKLAHRGGRQISNNFQKSKNKIQTFRKMINYLNWNLLSIFNAKFEVFKSAKFSLIILPILLSACSYSFTGSSVPSHLKTIYIPFCIDNTGSGEPTLADDFTSKLIDQFISDNSLSVSDKSKTDAMLDCTINSIQDAPTVIQGGETVSMRRLTINARVIYKDYVLKKTVFDKQFSAYSDYKTDGDVSTLRSEAILSAVDLITEDILLAVVSDW